MCLKTPEAPKMPKPIAAPPAPEAAPEEIDNAVDSNAEQQKKKRRGKKQLRRGASGLQIGSTSSNSPSKPNVG